MRIIFSFSVSILFRDTFLNIQANTNISTLTNNSKLDDDADDNSDEGVGK